MNADWLLTPALTPGTADLSSPRGEGRAGAELGPCSGTTGKNNPGGSDNLALALLRQLWLGFVLLCQQCLRLEGTPATVPQCHQPLPAQHPSGTPVPWVPTLCCHSLLLQIKRSKGRSDAAGGAGREPQPQHRLGIWCLLLLPAHPRAARPGGQCPARDSNGICSSCFLNTQGAQTCSDTGLGLC